MVRRKATPADLPVIMDIIRQAQRGLAELEVDQWQDGYPDEAAFLRDMEHGYCYVAVEDAEITECTPGQILGVAAIIPDGEPDYDRIYEGNWLNEGSYMTVHRVAVDDRVKRKGVASFLLTEAAEMAREQGLQSLRLDTHPDNQRMQACLERNGLQCCGRIYLSRGGDARLAYEKCL